MVALAGLVLWLPACVQSYAATFLIASRPLGPIGNQPNRQDAEEAARIVNDVAREHGSRASVPRSRAERFSSIRAPSTQPSRR